MNRTVFASRTLVLLIILALLAVAGCSGGGDGGVSTPPPEGNVAEFGRFLAFGSQATNLIAGEVQPAQGKVPQIYLVDRKLGGIERVSVADDGTPANDTSEWPSTSWDGNVVAFFSYADNLVPDDTNMESDIFVRDRATGETTRVSVASDGTQANGFSRHTSISGDGRLVAFRSYASNLVPNDTNQTDDIFVHDRASGVTERVSVATGGGQANGSSRYPALSADGRYVAFFSDATDLVENDTNGTADVFVHDRSAGTTVRVSVASDGSQADGWSGDPCISALGRYVGFTSNATNLVPDDTNQAADVFRHDLVTGQTVRVSLDEQGQEWTFGGWDPWISPDGGRLCFSTEVPTGMVEQGGYVQIIARDVEQGHSWLVSANRNDEPGNDYCFESLMGLDATSVFFASRATDLVEGDTNDQWDIFERNLADHATRRLNLGPEGQQANDYSYMFIRD